jgi:hypothetical protein
MAEGLYPLLMHISRTFPVHFAYILLQTGASYGNGPDGTPEPTDQELRILRDEVDPAGFAIGRR